MTSGPARPKPGEEPVPEPAEEEEKKPEKQHAPLPFDHLASQKRVSWDELKEKLANANTRQEGMPGEKLFEASAAALEKNRNDRLQKQEEETKKMLKQASKVSEKKMKKLRKGMKKEGGLKRTADGAILANSDDDESSA